ncbi:MAG TPA: YggU family protein [Dissulfuribacter thermophilus]|uniref:UPF0235 protein ENJ63_01930 n=1 Tax=Dissulfuribacter thermophilus TaxID=1156395 RepID=A0A7V2SVM5_9BACT|nr:YggU family protein [Dissulfuribacter thermophilus]
MTKFYDAKRNGIILRVHLQPRAKRNEIVGIHGDSIKIRLKAPPVDGKANEEARRFLAKVLGIKRQQVILKTGTTSRSKSFLIKDVDINTIENKLGPMVGPLP